MKRKQKRYSDYSTDRVHDFIFNCGGIASGSVIAIALHMSLSCAQCNAREAICRYSDIESVPGVGYRKKGIECSYHISANLFSQNDDCIYGWEGPVFKRMSDYNKALDAFDNWWPSNGDIEKQVELWMTTHPLDTFTIKMTLFDGNDNEIGLKIYKRGEEDSCEIKI